jgi:hypothetical protein
MRIDDMKPGPELDALVAEKVMGWKVGASWGGVYWVDTDGCSRYERTLFKPSQEWECMRLVVEEMQQRDYAFGILWSNKTKLARFHGGPLHLVSESTGSSITHATVLAAIKALQGEDTQP